MITVALGLSSKLQLLRLLEHPSCKVLQCIAILVSLQRDT